VTIQTIRTPAALLLAAGLLAGCEGAMNPFATREAVEVFVPVTTESDFRAQVVGREVSYANGAVGTYGEDGTWAVTGATGVLASGTWEWSEDGRWCYEGRTSGGAVPPTCEAVAVSGESVRFTRADGTEGTLPFRL
jgi:hypothetical protein